MLFLWLQLWNLRKMGRSWVIAMVTFLCVKYALNDIARYSSSQLKYISLRLVNLTAKNLFHFCICFDTLLFSGHPVASGDLGLRKPSHVTVLYCSEMKWSHSIDQFSGLASFLANRMASFRFGAIRNRHIRTWSKFFWEQ